MTIFAWTFQANGVLIRADILIRNENDQIRLIEVKVAKKAKGYYLYDCAIQLWNARFSRTNLPWYLNSEPRNPTGKIRNEMFATLYQLSKIVNKINAIEFSGGTAKCITRETGIMFPSPPRSIPGVLRKE